MSQQSDTQQQSRYPIIKIDKQEWNKKVSATLMYTIPAEDEAIPVLTELQEILQRLVKLPLSQTLSQQVVQFFFVQVFPQVCQKIIKSRYFKNQTVLKKANKVLQLSVCLLPIYIDLLDSIPQFIQIIYSVFPADQFYFKTNNQLDYRTNPYSYFDKPNNEFQKTLKVTDKVDIIKFANGNQKICWTQGTVQQIDQQFIRVKYDLDLQDSETKIDRNSFLIAPYQTQSTSFQWRKKIKAGDLIDSLDSFGGWYNATVLQVKQKQGGKRQLQISFKVYNQNGTKVDQKGKYFGFAQYNQTVDAFSAKVQPYCSVAKQFYYEASKSQFDVIDDFNDMQINQINGKTVYAFPRKKHLSQFIFQTLNQFGSLGGFQKVIKKLQEKNDIGMLSFYVKGLSGAAPYLHKRVVLEQIQKLKKMLQANLFKQENPKNMYTKQKSQMLFTGFRALLKRLFNSQVAYQYQNNLKIQLVNNCFKHQSLKRKLHGLNQLKQIVKSLTYGSSRNKGIVNWIKQNKIFQKIYLVNSHVQLIKKSQSFFRYIINEGILQIEDLQKLLKMAQKGDYQTRISLYSLFKQVTHIFKKNHVDFMIDKILQTQAHLILNQDIDLLHELAKYSNYFPTKKVMAFFQNLILGQGITQQLNRYAIKKYGQMISKNYQMKPYRKQVIKDLLLKLKTHDIDKISKILKQIFQGIGVGQWGKKELGQILITQKFDQIIVDAIQHSKENQNKILITEQSMGLLLNIYKLCSTFIIKVKILEKIWKIIADCNQSRKHFFKWVNQVLKCQQGIQIEEIDEFQALIQSLFKNQNILNSNLGQFQLFKSLFTQINKRKKYLTVSNIIRQKQIQKQYKRKVALKNLAFYKKLIDFIYQSESSLVSDNAMTFFITLYSSSQNSQAQVEEFLTQNISYLKQHISQTITTQASQKLNQTLKIISMIIDDSEKSASVKIDSLVSKKKNYNVKLNIINEVSYSTDSIKKMEVTLPINSTLFQLREHLAKQLTVQWQAIRIVAKKQLTINQNCRTLKQLNIDPTQTITISRKAVPSQPQGEIIIDGQLNPKAIRVFQIIFGMYSTDGFMNKAQCHQFTVKCLGAASTPKYYSDKIESLYKQYNQAKDDMLTCQQFLKFYKNSATSRSSTVWSNLRSFGVQGNFKFSYQASEQIKYQELPRVIMSKNSQVYDILFRLVKEKSLVNEAFQLLERLPISKMVQEQILSVQQQQFDFGKILNTDDLYIFFYKLNIIEYLLTSKYLQTEQQQNWISRFIASKGHDRLNDLLFTFIQKYSHQNSTKIQKEIIHIFIGLIYDYSFHCYFSHHVANCVALFQSQYDIDDKMQYIVTGRFPKKQMTLTIQQDELEHFQILQKSQAQISDKLIFLLEKLWIGLKFQTLTFTTDSLINKILSLLSILLVNQDLSHIVSKIKVFNSTSTSLKNMRKIYLLVMCVCFNSNEGQKAVISEMFNNLTMENIISEHFGILAVLVSKYGISEVQEDSMSDILMMNILKSDNQLAIEGCAMLLQNFNLSNVKEQKFDQLWSDCLFGQDRKCKKEQTREAIYKLLLKISQKNVDLTNYIIKKVNSTVLQCLQHMRITSCVQDNQRSLNGHAGLKNLGNICYINSMMQQLYLNKNFRYFILRINDNQPENLVQHKQKYYDDNILHQLKKLFAYLELTTRVDYVPDGFCFAYKPFGQPVNIMMQQDVQQFVSMFFDQLQNKIKQTPFKRILDFFYGGKSTNLFSCHECKQIKKRQQNFYSITLQVKNSKTLAESFNRQISGQLISDFHCDFCNKKVDVSKKTRVSKLPRTLLIHLQRMVFNLDTFINQKITTRHQFPMDLNLYQYSLAEFEKSKDITAEQEKLIKDSMDYHLKGIICHIGNAESGHYISYIKIQENKWLQFNDSIINTFSSVSIQTQCFGGNVSAYMDQFQWDRASQSSKSAYILLYERQGDTQIQLTIKDLTQKGVLLKQLCLNQVLQKLQKNEAEQQRKVQKREEQKCSSSDDQEQTDLEEQMLKLQEQQKIRKKSRDLQLEIQLQFQKDKLMNKVSKQKFQKEQQKQLIVRIDQNISPFIPASLRKQILNDNNIHFFEKCLASQAFIKFFSKLLQQQHSLHDQMFQLLKKLTFGFWMKSPQFKQLLKTCSAFIKFDNKFIDKIIFQNMVLITTMIQYSDLEVRSSVSNFLATSISNVIQNNKLTLNKENSLDIKIQMYLDNLFALIPTTVSKAWTKFNQYFQFWAQFAQKGDVQLKYMIKKQVLKHFLDYYLDKKSPLMIYKNKPQIGSKYANPNFTNLLKTVTYMLGKILQTEELQLSKDDYQLLVHYDCMEKLITQNYQGLACELVKGLCRNNLYTSEKLTIILLKGLNKATFNNVQPYLDVLQNFVLIDDKYQDLRIKWVLGKPVLLINTTFKYVNAYHGFSFDQRLYTYHSTISIQQGASLLDPIFQLHRRAQNFAMMSLRAALKLCLYDQHILNYIWSLPPPTLIYAKYVDFFIHFIDKYLQEAQRAYNYSQSGLNKQELGKQVKQLYQKVCLKWQQINAQKQKQRQKQKQQQQSPKKSTNQQAQKQLEQPAIQQQKKQQVTEQQQADQDLLNLDLEPRAKGVYLPVQFKFTQKEKSQINGLKITEHQSQIIMLMLRPTGKGNTSFSTGGMQKNIDKIQKDAWKTAKAQIVKGFYVVNDTRQLLRLKTEEGSQLVKPGESSWIWAQNIQRVFVCERTSDWPKWSLYALQNQQEIKEGGVK